MKKDTLKHRVSKVEEKLSLLNNKLDHLLVNDLPHINQELVSLKRTIGVASIINLVFILLAVLFI